MTPAELTELRLTSDAITDVLILIAIGLVLHLLRKPPLPPKRRRKPARPAARSTRATKGRWSDAA